MLLKCITILSIIAVAQPASIHERDIPVKVVYDEERIGVRNLVDKAHLPQNQLVQDSSNKNYQLLKENQNDVAEPPKQEVSSEQPIQEKLPSQQETNQELLNNEDKKPELLPEVPQLASNGVKNLDEKVQLSPEELGQAIKHLPVQESLEDNLVKQENSQKIVTPEDVSNNAEKQLESSSTNEALPSGNQQAPLSTHALLNHLQDYVKNSLKNIRQSYEALAVKDKNAPQPTQQDWDNLNRAVENLVEEQKKELEKQENNQNNQNNNENNQNNQGIIQNFINGIGNIVNSIRPPANVSEEENGGIQNQNFGQQFITFVSNGLNSMVIQLTGGQNQQAAGGNSTVLGEEPQKPVQQQNVFTNVINTVQNFLQGGGGGTQQGGSTQGDTGTGPTQSQSGNIIQNIGNAISNFNPFGSQNGQRPPNASGDEGTQGGGSPTFIQNIQQTFQNLNPFNQQNRPGGGGGQGGSQAQGGSQGQDQNPVAAAGAVAGSVSNQIQQLVGQGSGGGSSPVQSLQNAIAGAAGGSPTKQPAPVDEKPALQKDESLQNAEKVEPVLLQGEVKPVEKKEEMMVTAE